jgi:hypothetical protein
LKKFKTACVVKIKAQDDEELILIEKQNHLFSIFYISGLVLAHLKLTKKI